MSARASVMLKHFSLLRGALLLALAMLTHIPLLAPAARGRAPLAAARRGASPAAALRRASLVALAGVVGAVGVLALGGAVEAQSPGEGFSLSLELVPLTPATDGAVRGADGGNQYPFVPFPTRDETAPPADADNVVEPGQELYVRGVLRYVGDAFPNRYFVDDGLRLLNLRMNFSGNLDWVNDRSQLIVDEVVPDTIQHVPPHSPKVNAFSDMEAVGPDGGPLPIGSRMIMKAWDERTIVGTGFHPRLHIFDAYTKRQAAIIEAPEGADRSDAGGFGSSGGGGPNGYGYGAHNGRAVAVWHESEDIAWIFAASPNDSVIEGGETRRFVGALYVFKLDWSTLPPTITQEAKLQPSPSETGNTFLTTSDHDYRANYGSSVDISADGSTLAVAAHAMNVIGAIYVYTQPAGGWGELSYDEGVKVTAAEIPSLGSSAATMPFTPGASGSTDAAADCNTYCENFWRKIAGGLGRYRVSLSEDGTVLAAGAAYTRYGAHAVKSNMQFDGSHSGSRLVKYWSGEAYMWVAPAGGWNSAADATVDSNENPKTVIAAKENANAFRPATHVSPGPRKRITEPTATLVRRGTYADLQNDRFWGYWVEVSLDGSLILVGSGGTNSGAGNARAAPEFNGQYGDWRGDAGELAFFKRPAGGWAVGDSARTPDEVINGFTWGGGGWGSPGQGGIALNHDASRIIVGIPNDSLHDWGHIRLFKRPEGGWAGGAMTARAISNQAYQEPMMQLGSASAYPSRSYNPRQRRTASFGMVLQNLNRDRVLVSAIGTRHYDGPGGLGSGFADGPGRVYFDDSGCTAEFVDGQRVNTCPFILNDVGRFTVPSWAEGKYTVSANVKVQLGDDTASAVDLSGSLDFEVGTVKHVDSASLEFASDNRGTADPNDDRPYPSSIAKGESTRMRLEVLSDRGKPTDAAGIATIIARTSRGTLSATVERPARSVVLCTRTTICRIDGSRLDDNTPGEIVLTLDYGGEPGPADVSALAISTQGDQAEAETVRVTFTGPAATLTMSAPATGVLGVDTADAGDEDVAEDEVDNRDVLKLSVSAADASGSKVSPPTTGRAPSWTVTGPDGARVTRGLSVAWPLGGRESPTLDDDRNWQVELNVDRVAAERLPNGEYTLTVTAGALSAEQKFTVTGGAASVSLGEPSPAPAVGASFTVTATVTDSEGAAVPNGTRVTWEALGLTEGVTSIVQTSAQSVTSDGTATATYLVVGPGVSSVTAGSPGATSDVARIGVADPSASEAPRSAAELLSSTTPGAPSSWLGSESIMASDLLASLEGVNTVLLWQYTKWIRYSVVDGRVVPGSFDFQVQPGGVLWLGG